MDDHLLNATYYSPELEEPLESTAMLGNIVHSDSPNHVETAASVGKSTLTLHTVSFAVCKKVHKILFLDLKCQFSGGQEKERENCHSY